MKEIELIFNGLGYKDVMQACVIIYDLDNNIICKKETYNGRMLLCLKKNSLYKLIAKSNAGFIKKHFYIINNCDKYIFNFNKCILYQNQSRIITFLLTDRNYKNLPIMKGMITLWQRQ
ncbi:MAG: hypothetical protein E7158_00865 [Firmicutes bacterium]|nr:hypothetical protein [Bacillota bacterium]